MMDGKTVRNMYNVIQLTRNTVHLPGCTIEIYHEARSHESQKFSEVAFYAREPFLDTHMLKN